MDLDIVLRQQQPTARQWQTWTTRQPALADIRPRRLHTALRDSPPDRRDAVLAALLRLSSLDRYAGVVVAGCLVPGVRALIVTYARGLDRGDAVSIGVAGLWESIRHHAPVPPVRHVASIVLRIPQWRLQSAVTAERTRRRHTSHGAEIPDLADDRVDARVEDWAGMALLGEAVDAGVITRTDAWLLHATRLDGWRLTDAARQLGLGYDTARKRRQRAGHRWAAWTAAQERAANGAAARPGTRQRGPA